MTEFLLGWHVVKCYDLGLSKSGDALWLTYVTLQRKRPANGRRMLYVVSVVFWLQRSVAQAPVVQKLDNAIHRINHYPADSVVYFVKIYPLDSDLSGG